jgi:hypothetical protein
MTRLNDIPPMTYVPEDRPTNQVPEGGGMLIDASGLVPAGKNPGLQPCASCEVYAGGAPRVTPPASAWRGSRSVAPGPSPGLASFGGGATTVIEWQPFVTINQVDDVEIIQHESQWLDTRGYSTATLDILVTRKSTGCLYLRMCDIPDGNWVDVISGGLGLDEGSYSVTLSRDLPRSHSSYLRRFIRWQSNNAAKEFCFRIVVQLNR